MSTQFKILAQIQAPGKDTDQLVYQPPVGKTGLIAGVRVVSSWPLAEQRNLTPSPVYSFIRFDRQGNGINPAIFPAFDVEINSNRFLFTPDDTYRIGHNGSSALGGARNFRIESKSFNTRETGDEYKKYGSRSLFWLLAGTQRITGTLVSPNVDRHLDLRVPVIDRDHPLKVHNGWLPALCEDENRPTMLANHHKRCSTLLITVYGQEV